ncbi:MAG: 50S ribosomal protein L3 [Opitutae bacterium]|jgi:large subunit ribosomal protein L3|nr:50S ribosomal protein L3 [Opitutae bacterium]MBT4224319.1 50S ribosomal protein L3 [Opitutae bacterium]MBT5377840.1 50S ribosomal protein L3 [Opitutae bacterium]MBT5692220.1 50S ribosomal protein L3 [Opitutae bacterium]MBT6463677.1 50S ribosomal protein L3 [Opitutae bacterium]
MSFELIGKKIGMTQVYDDENNVQVVTVVEVGPCPVVQVKTKERDGYNAVQIGYGEQKEHRVPKPVLGHLKKAGVAPVSTLQEFRTETPSDYEPGQILTVEKFKEIEKVDVIGTTKGRGFQGVVRRYNYAGGPASHGSMFHRRGGSYGMCQWPGRIIKNTKMPGHMGAVRRTAQNLKIVRVDSERNILLVEGSFPGAKGGIVTIRPAIKGPKV